MPSLEGYNMNRPVKLLYIGDTGSGKTGSLVSLVKAGYNLRILDFDNGLEPLFHYVRKECPDKLGSIFYITLTDKLKKTQIVRDGKVEEVVGLDGPAFAWPSCERLINKWTIKDGEDLGYISSWTTDDVLVVDSLTFGSNSAWRAASLLNGYGGSLRYEAINEGMNKIESLLGALYAEQTPCNVIITSHIVESDRSDGTTRGLPNTLGKKLPPKVGRYFNTIIEAKTFAVGMSQTHNIITQSDGIVELKNPCPTLIPRTLPLGTGLAEIFSIIRAQGVEVKEKEAAEA